MLWGYPGKHTEARKPLPGGRNRMQRRSKGTVATGMPIARLLSHSHLEIALGYGRVRAARLAQLRASVRAFRHHAVESSTGLSFALILLFGLEFLALALCGATRGRHSGARRPVADRHRARCRVDHRGGLWHGRGTVAFAALSLRSDARLQGLTALAAGDCDRQRRNRRVWLRRCDRHVRSPARCRVHARRAALLDR